MADPKHATGKGASRHTCQHLRRHERREEAQARQAARDKRSYEQQLALLATRPGDALREKRRLA